MKHPIDFRREVESDVDQAFTWYETQRPGLGLDFVRAVENTYQDIQWYPLSHPIIEGRVHKASIVRFPYRIYYRLHDDRIIVLGIFHAARSSDALAQRL